MAKDPKKLREEAKKLLAEAEQIEQSMALKIGKLVLKYAEDSFKDFSLETFKTQIEKF